ncbi:efflux RND transporter periplasmic adaptor subunit [Halomonas sp. Bachu 37]|uniref:efflux RND transporter periplasmic adaptor subunit n=1 Tax=Halomonas kashgarensis TaxID=3084920 RepID=UPI00321807F6
MPAKFIRLVLGLLVLFTVVGCNQSQSQSPQQESVRPVKLITLDDASATLLRQFPARVEASTRSNLSFRMAGELLELNVEAGQRVEEGDVIARIDDRIARSELDSARSSLELAEATFERMRYTVERGAISQARFDEAKSELRAARSAYEQAEEQLEHTRLRAPYDGVIARVPVDNRQFVQVQETVAVIQQPGQLDVVFHLPEQIVRRMTPSSESSLPFADELAHEVRFSNDGAPYLAQLKSYTTQASEQSLAYEVTLTLPQPDDITLLDGMSANVRLNLGAWMSRDIGAVWRVPPEAVSYAADDPDQARVWRFEAPDSLEPVPVEVGTLTSQGLEVSGDLAAGDRLVSAGAHRLQKGMTVTPWEKERGL